MANYIKLIHGSFFFAGPICLTGKDAEIQIDASTLDVNTIRAINACQASRIIDTDIPIYVEETTNDIFIESEVAEEVEEEATTEEVAVVDNKPEESETAPVEEEKTEPVVAAVTRGAGRRPKRV